MQNLIMILSYYHLRKKYMNNIIIKILNKRID